MRRHCVLIHRIVFGSSKGRHQHLKNPRIAANNIQRKRISGSALSINSSMDDDNPNGGSPAASVRRSFNPPINANGKIDSKVPTTIQPSRSEMDLTRRRRRSATATSATNSPSSSSFLLSPSGLGLAPSGFGTGVSSSLLKNANLAAAEAKAERKRRSSLHQLIGLACKDHKKEETPEHEGVGRPRSKSETLEHSLKIK